MCIRDSCNATVRLSSLRYDNGSSHSMIFPRLGHPSTLCRNFIRHLCLCNFMRVRKSNMPYNTGITTGNCRAHSLFSLLFTTPWITPKTSNEIMATIVKVRSESIIATTLHSAQQLRQEIISKVWILARSVRGVHGPEQ